MVHYSVRRDVSTNDGHRHGGGKVVGKEVRRCKFIHFNAACNHSQERANSSTFFIRARYWYVLLLVTLPFIERNCAFVLPAMHYAVCPRTIINSILLKFIQTHGQLSAVIFLNSNWIVKLLLKRMNLFVSFFSRGTPDISFII